jgi:hypothetical protein
VLVNVSSDSSIQFNWIFPPNAQVISQTSELAIVRFINEGVYKIKLKSKNSLDCEDIYESEIFIENNPNPDGTLSSNGILIKQFIVAPNPVTLTSSGNVNVVVELANILPIDVSIFSLSTGIRVKTASSNASTVHSLNFDMSALASGYYYVVLTTPGSIQARKLIKE